MKRISIFLVLVITITACMPLAINAYTNTLLSEQTAKELLFKAADFIQKIYAPISGIQYDASDYLEIHPYYYYLVNEENLPGGSFEAIKEYSESIFTEDIAYVMYSHCRSNYDDPIFIKDNIGKLRMASNESSFYMTWWYSVLDWSDFTIDDITIQLARSNKSEATVWVKCTSESNGDFWIECYMVNTYDGWRIAESPFTHFLEWGESRMGLWEQGVYPFNFSPSTADPAFDLVFILPTVSVAALASTFCLMRRRRDLI
ncbi:MAG: hypothetical protein IKK74_04010 [Clostridia bacterium]|nr:hypothetical protein [Clostridia bacterium]